MQDFAGKVAVITGAASGIGKALTEKCIAEGMHVVMADIEEAVLEKAAAELQATTNNHVLPIVANVAMEAELRKVRDEAVETLGGVHLLFNNAGVDGGGNSWNATQKDWDWVFGVNLWSVIYGLRVFVPQMIAQETPCHIVNTASIAGIIGGSTNAPLLRYQAWRGCADGKSLRGSQGGRHKHWLLCALSGVRQYQHF